MANGRAQLAALSDPTRLAILERLAKHPLPVGELAAGLPVTRPAVSQHLKVLKAAALVRDHAAGTRRVYSIDSAGLRQIRQWLDGFWDASLAAYAQAAEEDKA